MLDEGVVEGEGGGRGGGGEGGREEERSVEGDAMRREGARKARPLLWVDKFKIHLLPSLPVLPLSLLSPQPLLPPLLLLLLRLSPLNLLLLLLSLPLNVSFLFPFCAHESNNFRCVRGATLIDIGAVITISDTITV